jgi:subtilisin family serine protease
VFAALAFTAFSSWADTDNSFILQVDRVTPELITQLENSGARITRKYTNIDAIAIELPAGDAAALKQISGIGGIYKDRKMGIPEPVKGATATLAARDIGGVVEYDAIKNDLPADYFRSHNLTGASTLFGAGLDGSGVVVAVIDSGTANNPEVVPALAGSVIGGENFVADDPESATSTANGPHGTWVGTTIAGHTAFLFSPESTLAQSIRQHAPDSIIPDYAGSGLDLVPMFGSAPGAQLYAMKVFSSLGGGAPESRIIAAMDRAITLRKNYDAGMPVVPVSGSGTEDDPYVYDSLPIGVVNMSLGGPTLFAGGDLEDQMTQAMLDAGIVVVVSAGNDGFAGMTIGSPGSGKGSLTVGAVNTAAHERILRDIQYGLGAGDLFRPTDHLQMAYFSSRGPNADGRNDPDVVSMGFATFVQGPTGSLNLVSGTSFSAPDVAGGAALLRQAAPDASAPAIRKALKRSANPMPMMDTAGDMDQGSGLVDYPAALAMLESMGYDMMPGMKHRHGWKHHKRPSKKVARNVKRLGYKILKAKRPKTFSLDRLDPGEVAHFFIKAGDETDRIVINLANLDLGPDDAQNAFFGNDLYVRVQDAITSAEVTLYENFLSTDTEIVIDNPQTGLIRVAVMGDWTNAAPVSAELTVQTFKGEEAEESAKGKIAQGAYAAYGVEIPGGTTSFDIELSWKENWGYYPTDDLDLILLTPSGEVLYDGATFNSPEHVSLENPEAGSWTILVNGFTVHEDIGKMRRRHHHDDDDDDRRKPPTAKWELSVSADGNPLPLQ